MVKDDEVFECYECGGYFDAQHIESKYEFDLCLFCEADCHDFHFEVDSLNSESESEDPDYEPETEPESEDYETDETEDSVEEMQIVCIGDVCDVIKK